MQLRPYQMNVEKNIYAAWENGAQNILIQLDTGSGKTVIFTKILSDFSYPCIAIAHRIELVSQISLTLARWNVRHSLIAQPNAIKNIVALHIAEFGKSFYNPQAQCFVAGVDTLIRMSEPWFQKIKLVVQDEGHHPLKHNKWGKAAALFPNAKGLYLTATPIRADGRGLGRHADGLMDALIIGPQMRDLINQGYLTKYKVFSPPNNLDLSNVTISNSGDYSPVKLRTAVHKSHITGDIVSHYLRIAPGKLGVTFAVDIEAATEISHEFRKAGVASEVISSKTPDILRYRIMRQFKNREILQLVNVDLLGEGVDVPAIEVVSMARPTQSYALYSQQFGRALRPMENKEYAIIIDHVGNIYRHGLPDSFRTWSLDRRERRPRSAINNIIRTCLKCFMVYEKTHNKCPQCGYIITPASRSKPEYVDGDLLELDETALTKLRGEINHVDNAPKIPKHLSPIIQRAIQNNHLTRQQKQKNLREAIALWAGHYKQLNETDSFIYKKFYFAFGIDILNAQLLNAKDAQLLELKIKNQLGI